MNLPEITVVAGIIYNSENKILITKRADHLHLGGLWEFPGGKVEKGETHSEALIREIREETNLEIEIRELFWQESIDYPKKRVHLFFYNCKIHNHQKIKMNEIADYNWVINRDLFNYKFPEGDTRLIKELQK